jgi:arsenate reductase
MKIYTYKNCSTCQKATAWLADRGITYEEFPIRETPPSELELKKVLARYDGQLRRLFNTAGGDYRELDMKTRLPDMTIEEALSLLASRGNLVKRPFVVGPSIGLVGFKETEWSSAFSGKLKLKQ